MSTLFAERPSFFEGQYLSAADLEAFLRYSREQDARHRLASHTWGILSGLELVAVPASGGGDVENYLLTPGVAVDGYGRMLVLMDPFRLTSELFARESSGRVDVWIRLQDTPFAGTRQGFGSCTCDDSYARVAESVVVEVGRRSPISRHQSGVVVGEEAFSDAREALGSLLKNRPLACDGSVAAQAFPEAEESDLWLIPVGQVPWSASPVNAFPMPTEADQKASLMARRIAGLVTGHIFPTSGLIRLRPRWTQRTSAGIEQDCAGHALQEADLVSCTSGELGFRELIWLEGHSRCTGDVRLYGSRLEFQGPNGTDVLASPAPGVPLALRRRERTATARLAAGVDLEVLLGARPTGGGPTRLSVGSAAPVSSPDPCAVDFNHTAGVVIQEDAKVGIGAADTLLGLPLTIRALGATGDLVGFQDASGSVAWQMNFGPSNNGLNFTEANKTETRLFLAAGGNVGIGTLTPEAKLDLRAVSTAGQSGLAVGKWFQAGDGDGKGRLWLQYGPQLAPLLVLSDKDDPPRLQFQQLGSGQEATPTHASWIGHARGNSSDLALMGGNVGINTDQPQRRLHVQDSEIHSGGTAGGFSFSNRGSGFINNPPNGERWVWYAQDQCARLWSGGNKLSVSAGGSLGIGTDNPSERLEVRGNIKLGTNGTYFGVGCLDNWRMIAGRVDVNGTRADGSGFTSSRLSDGRYEITFTVGFSSVPVVVATLVAALNQDNFLTIENLSSTSFILQSMDDEPGRERSVQDSAFNFIALGPRA
ncbi:MAG: hypothetical protein ACKOYH_00965 [Cyanobium sp.]